MLEWMFTTKQLIDYIDANAISNPSLTDIAEQVGYSTYHCSEQFHKVAGMTIREYISKRKLYAAAMALQKTQDAIIDIALDCGFSSQQALTRAFRKAFGCSPATYRKNPDHFSSTIIKEVELVMESRGVFDAIPEEFDKYRPHYSQELFDDLIRYANIGENKSVLALGPGTGQATDPILDTGCEYHCIELGKYLAVKIQHQNAVNYGYIDYEKREYQGRRILNADQYISLVGTHSDHIMIPEPHRTPFFTGLRQAVVDAGNVIEYLDTHVLMLARKPFE